MLDSTYDLFERDLDRIKFVRSCFDNKWSLQAMNSAKCISCGSSIRFRQETGIGEMVKCSSCYTELEVVWLDPIELDWPYIDDDNGYYDEFDSDDFYDDKDY